VHVLPFRYSWQPSIPCVPETRAMSCDVLIFAEESADVVASVDLVDPDRRAVGPSGHGTTSTTPPAAALRRRQAPQHRRGPDDVNATKLTAPSLGRVHGELTVTTTALFTATSTCDRP